MEAFLNITKEFIEQLSRSGREAPLMNYIANMATMITWANQALPHLAILLTLDRNKSFALDSYHKEEIERLLKTAKEL